MKYISHDFITILFEEEFSKDIEVEHPGILEIPKGKFLKTPVSHFENMIKKKGYGEVVKALMNLERWNKGKGEEKEKIAKRARSVYNKIKQEEE